MYVVHGNILMMSFRFNVYYVFNTLIITMAAVFMLHHMLWRYAEQGDSTWDMY